MSVPNSLAMEESWWVSRAADAARFRREISRVTINFSRVMIRLEESALRDGELGACESCLIAGCGEVGAEGCEASVMNAPAAVSSAAGMTPFC